jgi:deoxyribose-phosphate aldolase
MLDVIRSRGALAGLKVAGGIRTLEQAAPYLALVERELGADACVPARLRIGASVLLDRIEAVLGGQAPARDVEGVGG